VEAVGGQEGSETIAGFILEPLLRLLDHTSHAFHLLHSLSHGESLSLVLSLDLHLTAETVLRGKEDVEPVSKGKASHSTPPR
jgi:hypothetical protein